MKRIALLAPIFLFSLFLLGACGTSTGDRAISGGAIGAGVGAPVEGALIGGAAGAGTGALTTLDQINLGRPIWK
jgi:hypothetical protein